MRIDGWIENELRHSSFGDTRLNRRFLEIADNFLKTPGAPINQASENWSSTIAAYRFFKNAQVTTESILRSHHLQTASRAAKHPWVLLSQDTMSANFTSHLVTQGLGHIGSASTRSDAEGIFVHTGYCMDVSGNPLGVLFQKQWERKKAVSKSRMQQKNQHRQKPIEAKESIRWIETISAARKFVPKSSGIIALEDREGDIFEFFSEAMNLGVSYIVRASNNRCFSTSEDTDNGDDEIYRLLETFIDETAIARAQVEVGGNGKRLARIADIEIYSRRICLQVPERIKFLQTNFNNLTPLEVSVVWVVERNPPAGVAAISWLLLSDLEVNTAQEALQIVKYYSYRWRIEEFHKILKSGCKIEDCRLESAERLEKFIATNSIVAHRICQLTYQQRQNPTASCETVLSEAEWKCLYLRVVGNKLPKKAPTINQVTRWIAQLGGFLGRKGDGDPGITTIWRGWTLFQESFAMMNAMLQGGSRTYV